ncbi:LacI family DNA-binding transcriptional regulator [Paenibacillus silvisoli]|uniref:LacI family DNA-binding transcriptional regulator n=1 Tax=Paenibacillus silvisoli TaxID=3110539 RepID=UPI002803A847|nr:LacI family DNA-binding transcriptional regulator [Paenibacillus silvisoli]
MTTIHDVAKKAGVSIATVSYALNNKKSIGKEKKELILKIAEEMGYVPNSLAKSLLKGKTNIIGLIGTDISEPYLGTLTSQLEKFARANGLFLLLGNTSNDRDHEQEIIRSFVSKNVDAILLFPGMYEQDSYQETVDYLNKVKTPFICLDRGLPGIETNYVVADIEEGEYAACQHLIANGHQEILFVGGDIRHPSTVRRQDGITRAMKEAGLSIGASGFLNCGYTFREGYEAVAAMLRSGASLPTALLTTNDSVAFGAIKALKEKGLRVPEDVSIVGYDDIVLPTMEELPLSTVRIPLDEMARVAIEGLQQLLSGELTTLRHTVRTELVVRASVRSM